jgi:hypothetical protein
LSDANERSTHPKEKSSARAKRSSRPSYASAPRGQQVQQELVFEGIPTRIELSRDRPRKTTSSAAATAAALNSGGARTPASRGNTNATRRANYMQQEFELGA